MPTHSALQRFGTWLGYRVPVRIRSGVAKGAWWTAYPHSAYWRSGGTEPESEMVVRRYGCRPDAVCWDLGAHFGIYTIGMAMHVGNNGQVVAVEPDPASFRRLKRHVQLNSIESTVHLVNAGASDRTGVEVLHLSQGAGATTSHFYYADEPHDSEDNTINVPVIALDDLVGDGKIRQPNFIKVDVEGHGARALQGCRSAVAATSPAILMGFHGKAELDGTRAVLEPLGYRPYSLFDQPIEWPWQDPTSTVLLKRE